MLYKYMFKSRRISCVNILFIEKYFLYFLLLKSLIFFFCRIVDFVLKENNVIWFLGKCVVMLLVLLFYN